MVEPRDHVRRCPDCLEPVPRRVRICPKCKSYLDWRRFVSFGQTNLALLIALISVSTSLIAVGVPFFRAQGSDLKFLFESATHESVSMIVRNDGRSSGIIRFVSFSVSIPDMRSSTMAIGIPHEGSIIEPGKETRVTFAPLTPNNQNHVCDHLVDKKFFDRFGKLPKGAISPPKDESIIDSRYFSMLAALKCTFHGVETNFYDTKRIHADSKCDGNQWITHCLISANSAFVK
jgi:hypothetical protein